jgi:hypothetical protein
MVQSLRTHRSRSTRGAEAVEVRMGEEAVEYYFNLSTREVEEGLVSSWSHRIGPYPTREAAERALETAARRGDAWDKDDRAWRGDAWRDES